MTRCFDWTTVLLFYQRDVKFTDQNEVDWSMVSWADRQTAYKLYISRWSVKERFCLRVKFFNYFGKRSIFLNETNCSENIQLYFNYIFIYNATFIYLLHKNVIIRKTTDETQLMMRSSLATQHYPHLVLKYLQSIVVFNRSNIPLTVAASVKSIRNHWLTFLKKHICLLFFIAFCCLLSLIFLVESSFVLFFINFVENCQNLFIIWLRPELQLPEVTTVSWRM